jgi:hypothetical protein
MHHVMKTWGGKERFLHAFLIEAQDGGMWSASLSGRFISEKETPVPTG